MIAQGHKFQIQVTTDAGTFTLDPTLTFTEEVLSKASLGSWGGMPIIGLGPKGGKIVGYKSNGKPIYANSSEAKKMATKLKAKKETKSTDEWSKAVKDWLVDQLGIPAKVTGKYVAVSAASGKMLDTQFGVSPHSVSMTTEVFKLKDLLNHLGKPFIPQTKEEAAHFQAKAASGELDKDPFPPLDELTHDKNLKSGQHTVDRYKDKSGKYWVFKTDNPTISKAEEAATRIARLILGPDHAAASKHVNLGGKSGVLLEWQEGAIFNDEGHSNPPQGVLQEHLPAIVQHQVVDWIISNHDSHAGNFLVTPKGKVGAIDKGQAWKFLGNDSLSTDYAPNSSKQIYIPFWNRWEAGKFSKKWSESDIIAAAGKALDSAEKITEAQFKSIVAPYIQNQVAWAESQGTTFNGPALEAKMWNRIKNARADFEKFLSGKFGHEVNIPKEGADNFETMPDAEPGKPKVIEGEAQQPVADTPPVAGWPVKKGKTTIHHPGDVVPGDVKWTKGYPGPGFKIQLDYKAKNYTVEFAVSGKQMVVAVAYPDGSVKTFKSPNAASNGILAFEKGWPLDITPMQIKEKGLSTYPAAKLMGLAKFKDELASAHTIPEGELEEKFAPPPVVTQPSLKDVAEKLMETIPEGDVPVVTAVQKPVLEPKPKLSPEWKPLATTNVSSYFADLKVGSEFVWTNDKGEQMKLIKVVDSNSIGTESWEVVTDGYSGMWTPEEIEQQYHYGELKNPVVKEVETYPKVSPDNWETMPEGLNIQEHENYLTALPVGSNLKYTGADGGQKILIKESEDIWDYGGMGFETTSVVAMSYGKKDLEILFSTPPDPVAVDYETHPIAPFAGPAPQVDTKAAGITVPPDAKPTETSPFPPGSSKTVQKKFPWGKKDVLLSLGNTGVFSVAIMGPEDTIFTGDFKSLSAASDWVWLQQKGEYKDAAAYKKATGKNKVPSGGGWKFWGIDSKAVQAPPIPEPVPEPVAVPEPEVNWKSIKSNSYYDVWKKLVEVPVGTKLKIINHNTGSVHVWNKADENEWTTPELEALDTPVHPATESLLVKNKNFPEKLDADFDWQLAEGVWDEESPGVGHVTPQKTYYDPKEAVALIDSGKAGPGSTFSFFVTDDPDPYKATILDHGSVKFEQAGEDPFHQPVAYLKDMLAVSLDTELGVDVIAVPTPGAPVTAPSAPGWETMPEGETIFASDLHGMPVGTQLKYWDKDYHEIVVSEKQSDGYWTIKKTSGGIVNNVMESSIAIDLSHALISASPQIEKLIPGTVTTTTISAPSEPGWETFQGYGEAKGAALSKLKAAPIGTMIEFTTSDGGNKFTMVKTAADLWKSPEGTGADTSNGLLGYLDEDDVAKIKYPGDAIPETPPIESGWSPVPASTVEALTTAEFNNVPAGTQWFYYDASQGWKTDVTITKNPNGLWNIISTSGAMKESNINGSTLLTDLKVSVAQGNIPKKKMPGGEAPAPTPSATSSVVTKPIADLLTVDPLHDLVKEAGGTLIVKKSKATKKDLTNIAINGMEKNQAAELLAQLADAYGLGQQMVNKGKVPKTTNYYGGGAFITVPTSALAKTKTLTLDHTQIEKLPAQEFKIKPKPPKPKELTPEEKAKIEKAKAVGEWLKATEPLSKPKELLVLAHLQNIGKIMYSGELNFWARKDSSGKILLGSPGDDFAVMMEDLKKEGLKFQKVETPLGSFFQVDTIGQLGKALPGQPAESMKGPDEKTYPKGTTFTTKTVTSSVKELLATEPGFYKFKTHKTDDTKSVLKVSGTGAEQEAQLVAMVSKYNLDTPGPIKGSGNVLTMVANAALDAVGETKEVHEATTPPQPPSYISAPYPTMGTAKAGQEGVNNRADLGALSTIDIGKFGHAIRMGKAGVFKNGQVYARKVKATDGNEYFEVHGEFNEPPSGKGLNTGTIGLPTAMTKGGGEFKLHAFEGGIHDESGPNAGSITHESGKTGTTSSGSAIKLFTPSASKAFQNMFSVRVPVGADMEAELADAFDSMGVDVASTMADQSPDDERLLIKAAIIKSMLGPKAWMKPSSVFPADKMNDEAWMDAKLSGLGVTPEMLASARIETTFDNHQSVVFDDPTVDNAKNIKFVYQGNSEEGIFYQFKDGSGWASRTARYMNGIEQGGASAQSDIHSGGANIAFSRIGTSSHSSNWGLKCEGWKVIFHPRVLKRADWRFYRSDSYATLNEDSDMRPRSGVTESMNASNEVGFDGGLSVKDAAGVMAPSGGAKASMIKKFTDEGITEINGIPLDQFIQVQVSNSRVQSAKLFPSLKAGMLP